MKANGCKLGINRCCFIYEPCIYNSEFESKLVQVAPCSTQKVYTQIVQNYSVASFETYFDLLTTDGRLMKFVIPGELHYTLH